MSGTNDRAHPGTGSVRFVLGGKVVEATGVAPTRSVLHYLREDLARPGTKEGCAEGDCGACTVVVGELSGDAVQMKAVNACIQFVPTLDGKALFTVEDLCGPDGGLHPVQQALVDCHGSQCGFCTPGFVMSLWALYLEQEAGRERPGETAIRNSLSGNLCRCTGYRPIIEAGGRMFDLPAAAFDREALRRQLLALRRSDSLALQHGGASFHAPRTLGELLRLRAQHPQATLLAGCTDIGLWVNKQFRELGDVIYLGEVEELKRVSSDGATLRIGAGASLNDAYRALCAHYPELTETWERFASTPIRNAGTMGGNVANGSPIGDSMPALIALGARVALASESGTRTLPMEDLYIGYMRKAMRPDEIVLAIEAPLPVDGLAFRTYKLSKRFDSDISAVCAAFAIVMKDGLIASARVAFGGMAATPSRARKTEAALVGQAWTEPAARAAMAALASDYAPLTDMRASAGYRKRAAQNLLYRFFLETRPVDALGARQLSVFAR